MQTKTSGKHPEKNEKLPTGEQQFIIHNIQTAVEQ
jgi:hypothetical protein